jgi:alkylation response protein AidB-like acyl-CoA dehydrogenase
MSSWAHLPPEHFLRAAEQFKPTILAQREAIERNRGLPPGLSHALRDGGFFSLWLPKALGGPELTPAELARMAGSHAAAAAVEVVNMMFAAAGAGGIHERGRLARCWRDAHTMSHHAGQSRFQLQIAGRVLMGLEPGTQHF